MKKIITIAKRILNGITNAIVKDFVGVYRFYSKLFKGDWKAAGHEAKTVIDYVNNFLEGYNRP